MANATIRADGELLALAASLLGTEGYAVESLDLDGGLPIVLAENHYSVVALTATATVQQLGVAEPVVEQYLAELMREVEIGAKIWDGYIVLMTQEGVGEVAAVSSYLFEISYDTRGVRRIVRAGVSPTATGVREALTPFLRPLELSSEALLNDPFDAMLDALVVRDVDERLASRVILAFRQGGDIDAAVT